jgi:hypothetical protein
MLMERPAFKRVLAQNEEYMKQLQPSA